MIKNEIEWACDNNLALHLYTLQGGWLSFPYLQSKLQNVNIIYSNREYYIALLFLWKIALNLAYTLKSHWKFWWRGGGWRMFITILKICSLKYKGFQNDSKYNKYQFEKDVLSSNFTWPLLNNVYI